VRRAKAPTPSGTKEKISVAILSIMELFSDQSDLHYPIVIQMILSLDASLCEHEFCDLGDLLRNYNNCRLFHKCPNLNVTSHDFNVFPDAPLSLFFHLLNHFSIVIFLIFFDLSTPGMYTAMDLVLPQVPILAALPGSRAYAKCTDNRHPSAKDGAYPTLCR
jgi:hypothetical protein